MTLPNRVVRQTPLRGEQAFVYGFKARAQRHHCLGYGTFTVDVSSLGELRKAYSKAVRPITYLPMYVKATALALRQNPEANAILFKTWFGYKVVQFEKVDVNLPITRRLGERPLTFIATIRDAVSKSLAEIQDEIAWHQQCPPEKSFAIQRVLRFEKVPFLLASWLHWRMAWNPSLYIRNVGTCGVTFLESEEGFDRIFPIAPTSVVFGIGGVAREPVARGDAVTVGRVLKCTLMADNFVVSGWTGMKLAKDFKQALERGAVAREESQPAWCPP
jgi:pyruvate/2-oxoglutarate dehydrogenase complex dihydrolipoamide acyltransferase (E2) component